MGQSNFYLRTFGEEPPAPTEIVSGETLERVECPLEYVGPTGKYDERGLAKRVALYLDLNEEIDECNTVTISQEGSTIIVVSSSSLDDAEWVRRQIQNYIDSCISSSDDNFDVTYGVYSNPNMSFGQDNTFTFLLSGIEGQAEACANSGCPPTPSPSPTPSPPSKN